MSMVNEPARSSAPGTSLLLPPPEALLPLRLDELRGGGRGAHQARLRATELSSPRVSSTAISSTRRTDGMPPRLARPPRSAERVGDLLLDAHAPAIGDGSGMLRRTQALGEPPPQDRRAARWRPATHRRSRRCSVQPPHPAAPHAHGRPRTISTAARSLSPSGRRPSVPSSSHKRRRLAADPVGRFDVADRPIEHRAGLEIVRDLVRPAEPAVDLEAPSWPPRWRRRCRHPCRSPRAPARAMRT